jgi:hypothetical protein
MLGYKSKSTGAGVNQPAHKKAGREGASGSAEHSRQEVVSTLIVALGLVFHKLFGGDPHEYQK